MCHHPHARYPFSMQLGEPNVLTAALNIPIIAHFRHQDIALGGQGAPLAPILHQALFGEYDKVGAVVNIGGIANITILGTETIGFDTGPGNTLMDQWIMQNQNKPYDDNGSWAARGKVIPALLQCWLSDAYFAQTIPKSTGREYFNLPWLGELTQYSDQDVQATLLALTVKSISQVIRQYVSDGKAVLVCGGGIHNQHLITCLQHENTHHTIESTAQYHIDPDFIEAQLMAYLAYLCLNNKPINLMSITGSTRPAILGGIFR